jgi:hypothetical protein
MSTKVDCSNSFYAWLAKTLPKYFVCIIPTPVPVPTPTPTPGPTPALSWDHLIGIGIKETRFGMSNIAIYATSILNH